MFKSAAAQGQEIIFMNLFDFEASEGLILLNLFYVIRQQKVVQSLHFFPKSTCIFLKIRSRIAVGIVIRNLWYFYKEFQNYLRTQAGNNTTVNIVICTVDYLLRLQESMMDFYWHYSGKDIIDPSGKGNFCRAINVAKQVFRTLTEYIQVENQLIFFIATLYFLLVLPVCNSF